MMPRELVLAAIGLLMFTGPAGAGTLTGRASVIDGDTLEIHGERIRILDVDAPESRQACTATDGTEWRCGQRAALAVADWIGTRPVTCEATKLDRYKRHLARCTIGGEDLAAWLASNGWAVPYRDCKCEIVREAAAEAKAARRGIWSGSFMLPWEWRKAN